MMIANDIKDIFKGSSYIRNEDRDDDKGWFGFTFNLGKKEVEVDIPGIEPQIVEASEPWKSPRLYVNGSSWLWGYALGFIGRGLGLGEDC